jgi:hypothetical protein
VPQVKPRVPIWQTGHPLARGCIACLPLHEGSGFPADVITRAVASFSAAPSWNASPFGPGISLSGSSGLILPSSVCNGNIETTSVIVIVKPGSGGASTQIVYEPWNNQYSVSRYPISLRRVATSKFSAFAYDGDQLPTVTTAEDYPDGAWYVLATTRSAKSSLSIYVNGILAASGNDTTSATSANGLPVSIGNRQDGNGAFGENGLVGDIAGILVYNRVLRSAEVNELSADPFALVRPHSRLIVPLTLSGAAPSAGTLAITLGATTLSATGTAAAAPASAGTLAETLGAMTLAATGTAAEAPASAGTLDATLGATTLSATGTAAAADAATGTLAATLGAVTLAATATAETAPATAGTLDATLGATTLSATGTAAEPGIVAGALVETLGAVTLAASGTAGTVDGAAGSLDVTLGAVTLAASGVAVAPGTATGTLAVTLGAMTLVASATSPDGVATVDMLDSIATVLDAIADLNTAFGSTGWFWHTLAPPRTPVPYVVWRESSGSVMGESGGASWLTDNTYSVSVYAATRAEARRLCRAAVAAIEAAADAGSIVFTEGALASLHREAGAFDQLDPDPGEDGADVWEHRITLRAFVDDQIIVS